MKILTPAEIFKRPILLNAKQLAKPHVQLLSNGDFILYVIVSSNGQLGDKGPFTVIKVMHNYLGHTVHKLLMAQDRGYRKHLLIDKAPIASGLYLHANLWSRKK